jgi:hypothetical protein
MKQTQICRAHETILRALDDLGGGVSVAADGIVIFRRAIAEYGRSIEACAEQLNQIPIVHLHGDLGALPWQKVEASREYGAIVSVEEIKVAASRIKIIHEDTADRDKEFGRAKEELGKATRDIFSWLRVQSYEYGSVRCCGYSGGDCGRNRASPHSA